MRLESKLRKWTEGRIITNDQAQAILALEKGNRSSRLFFGLGGLGALSLLLGIASFIAANWYKIPPETRILSHITVNFAVAFALLRSDSWDSWVRELLIALQAGLVLTFIALIGQTLQTQAPLWQSLGMWLVLATPMLWFYARHVGIIVVWLGILAVVSVDAAPDLLPHGQAQGALAALPFILMIFYRFRPVSAILKVWSEKTEGLFWFLVAAGTTVAQILWRSSNSGATYAKWSESIAPSALVVISVGTLIVCGLNMLARHKHLSLWPAKTMEWEGILAVSLVVGFAPFLIPHPDSIFFGCLFFCLYWLFMAAMGLRLGNDRLWSWALVLICLRLFVAYIEVMKSLAIQGFGFLLTGCVFLGLAWGFKKILRKKPSWLLASRNDGDIA